MLAAETPYTWEMKRTVSPGCTRYATYAADVELVAALGLDNVAEVAVPLEDVEAAGVVVEVVADATGVGPVATEVVVVLDAGSEVGAATCDVTVTPCVVVGGAARVSPLATRGVLCEPGLNSAPWVANTATSTGNRPRTGTSHHHCHRCRRAPRADGTACALRGCGGE
jgi:hypothetical protein